MPQHEEEGLYLVRTLQTYLDEHHFHVDIFLCGDFNCTLDPFDRKNCFKTKPRLAENVCKLCDKFDLIDIWLQFHPTHSHFTYNGSQQNSPMSWLDRIYYNQPSMRFVSDVSLFSVC